MNLSSDVPKILVIGSSSIDLVLKTDHIPHSNETIMANSIETFFGGKGANQAVGTARLGASVYFISCVGMDPYGQQVLRNLVDEGVNVGFVAESEETSTGTAYVTSASGENSIVVVPAANFQLKKSHINEAERLFHTADLILIQLEIPIDVVEHCVLLAKKHGKKVGIYASPAQKLSQEIIDYASFLVVKSNELSTVFHEDSRDEIMIKYPNKLFVRGDTNSTIFYNGSELKYYRNDHGEHPHKMGMGDAFTSGFAVAYCHHNEIKDCIKFGNEVSLKASEKMGSQSSLPKLKDFALQKI